MRRCGARSMMAANSGASGSRRRMATSAEVSRIIFVCSFGQTFFVIKKVAVIGGAEWFFQARGAVASDFEQAGGEGGLFGLDAAQPFAERFGDGFGDALSS